MLVYLQPAEPLLEASELLLIRTPLARITRTYPRRERATRTDGPALPVSFLRSIMLLQFFGGLSAD